MHLSRRGWTTRCPWGLFASAATTLRQERVMWPLRRGTLALLFKIKIIIILADKMEGVLKCLKILNGYSLILVQR